jgi:UDP-GlcNAc:undecaprenyl-phosphate GlcNAc-1-phosphate transferase
MILLMGLLCAVVGIVGELQQVPEYVMFWGFMVMLVVYSVVFQNIWVILRFIRRQG